MNDLVSRQAVIDAIMSLPSEQPNNVNITWSDKIPRKTKLYCSMSGYLCEFATEFGYCQITACVKGRRTE